MSTAIDGSLVVAALIDSGPHDEWAEDVLAVLTPRSRISFKASS